MNDLAVTFDVGGTLIEPWPSVGHVYAEVAADFGASLDPALLNRRFASAWQARSEFDYSRQAWAELVRMTFDGLWESAGSERFFSALYERFEAPDVWRIYEDVLPALEALQKHGVRLGLISNWDERLRPLLGRLDLLKHFEAIGISIECGCQKPEAEIFRRMAAALNVAESSLWHVGDNVREDVNGAVGAGCQGVLIRRGTLAENSGQVSSLCDLPEHIRKRAPSGLKN